MNIKQKKKTVLIFFLIFWKDFGERRETTAELEYLFSQIIKT